jgi:hypothetical protein
LGTLPRGRILQVFERAAGGWMRVGGESAEGWVHSSLVGSVAATTASSGQEALEVAVARESTAAPRYRPVRADWSSARSGSGNPSNGFSQDSSN